MATSKKSLVLKHMQRNKRGITGKDAYLKYGLYRLSSAIFELRKEGHNIKTEMMQKEEEDGSITTYARYYL